MKTAILVNDTSKVFHYGCQLVTENIRYLLEKNDIQLIHTILFQAYGIDKKVFDFLQKSTPDYIIINGEGSIHHNSRLGIELLGLAKTIKKSNKTIKVILINATIQEMDDYLYLLSFFDLIHVREPYSHKYLENNNFKAILTPDISLYGYPKRFHNQRSKGVLVGGSVVKKKIHEHITYAQKNKLPFKDILYFPKGTNLNPFIIIRKIQYVIARSINQQFGTSFLIRDPHKKISNLSQQTLYISGRFHDIYLAIKSGVNIIIISSNSYKIESTMEYIGLHGKVFPNIDSVNINNITYSEDEKKCVEKFYKKGILDIENLFTLIKKL